MNKLSKADVKNMLDMFDKIEDLDNVSSISLKLENSATATFSKLRNDGWRVEIEQLRVSPNYYDN